MSALKPKIYCKSTGPDAHSFYLVAEGREFYLFRQAYRSSIHRYFSRGIALDQVYDFSKARHNCAIIHTLAKLPLYIKYIESEYGVAVLRQTQKKLQTRDRRKLSA